MKFFFVLELLLGFGSVILTSLFSLFYFTGECYWVLTEDEPNYLCTGKKITGNRNEFRPKPKTEIKAPTDKLWEVSESLFLLFNFYTSKLVLLPKFFHLTPGYVPVKSKLQHPPPLLRHTPSI